MQLGSGKLVFLASRDWQKLHVSDATHLVLIFLIWQRRVIWVTRLAPCTCVFVSSRWDPAAAGSLCPPCHPPRTARAQAEPLSQLQPQETVEKCRPSLGANGAWGTDFACGCLVAGTCWCWKQVSVKVLPQAGQGEHPPRVREWLPLLSSGQEHGAAGLPPSLGIQKLLKQGRRKTNAWHSKPLENAACGGTSGRIRAGASRQEGCGSRRAACGVSISL